MIHPIKVIPAQLGAVNYLSNYCRCGVVHIGVGAFHRAHQAYYFHQLLNLGEHHWGITGINLMPQTSQVLQSGGLSYVLKTISPDCEVRYQQINSILRVRDNCRDTETIKVLTNADIQVVTITVTESGYYQTASGNLDTNHAYIQQDMQQHTSTTLFGFLSIALELRRQTNAAPLTIISCDNLPNNGNLLKHLFEQFLMLTHKHQLYKWLQKNVSFPCSVVDRITPKSNAQLASEIDQKFGRFGNDAVHCESFSQWIIEDKFSGVKPPLDKVGVVFSNQVKEYEKLKLRMLNGGHSCLAYYAALENYQRFDQAFADNKLQLFFQQTQMQEIMPTIDFFSQAEKQQYLNELCQRFANRHIADTIERICMDGLAKIQCYLIPSINDAFKLGIVPRNLIRSLAYWYIFLQKMKHRKIQFNYVDSSYESLQNLIQKGGSKAFAEAELIWGETLHHNRQFSQLLVAAISQLSDQY